MSSERKVRDSLGNLRKATDNLSEALAVSRENPLATEGTIQRFETVVELVWKTMQRALEYEGIHPRTPRETMKKGFLAGWLSDEIIWQELLDNRNSSSHEYLDEELIDSYYMDIARFYGPINEFLEFLEQRYT